MKVLLIGTGMVADTHVLALRDNTAGARLIGALVGTRHAQPPFAHARPTRWAT